MSLTIRFDDLVVLEWGDRVAVRACGSLLAQVGAIVAAREPGDPDDPLSRFKTPLAGSTKAERDALAGDALARANIVLLSSDRGDRLPPPGGRSDLIVCDIVAGDGAEASWPDALLQAVAGFADITGTSATPPSISDAPVIELQTAIFAASSILAAWRRRAATGKGQTITVSLFDCALNALSSFLPLAFTGNAPTRSGNRHPMAAPWNSYRASDGWLVVCSATDEHWRRICDLMGREDLKAGRLATLASRLAHCGETDAVVEAWTLTRSVADCVAALNSAGIAAGPIVRIDDLAEDPNLLFREAIARQPPPMPLAFIRAPRADAVGSGGEAAPAAAPARPLSGLRVVEIGQYTTAPVASKHLALLGAEVIKIEPPGGEASRAWPPHNGDLGYFFAMNNANKRSCVLDLRTAEGMETFTRLLRCSDVLVENLKPGSLDRLGMDSATLRRLNPGLTHCAISGFGRTSIFPGRPAFDTVVQAVSGLMDATQTEAGPMKLGISAADISGGIAGLFACLCGLEQRRRGGDGAHVDLSMQDVSAWLTQTLWNDAERPRHAVLRCADGYVAVDAPAALVADLRDELRRLTRREAMAKIAVRDLRVAPVRTLSEIAADPAIFGNGGIQSVTDRQGRHFPVFRPPYCFSAETTTPLEAVGALGEANDYVASLCS